MKAKLLAVGILLPTVLGLLAGCGKEALAPRNLQANDQSDASAVLLAAPELVDDGLIDAASQTSLASSLNRAPVSASAAIEPLTIWRSITRATRTFEYSFADTDSTGRPTTAFVTVHRHFMGTFNILKAQPTDSMASEGMPPETDAVIHKPLDDFWIRRVLLKRVQPEGREHMEWRIAAASGAEVYSQNVTTQIVSLRVQGAGLDTTIVDPLAFFYLRRVLRFAPDDSVTLTVTTERSDDVAVLYHHDHRERLVSNGDNTYTGGFRAGEVEGWRHFGVNALSRGTLFDDALPYDSRAWILPYAIATTPVVDYLP
jgi:hypothetical protein